MKRPTTTMMLLAALAAGGVPMEDRPIAWKCHAPDERPKPLTPADVEKIRAAEAKRERRRKRGW